MDNIQTSYAIVVDDDKESREEVKNVFPKGRLEKCRQFSSRKNFKERFLNSFSNGKALPGILFVDIRMEEARAGIELLKEIRKSEFLKLVPVIIISGSSDDEDILDAFNNGANLYIVKDDEPNVFKNAINKIVEAISTTGKLPSDILREN